MSHSTTNTATYVLVKYSRSYPKSDQDINLEWQHYTKPTLKLILDVKKSLTTGDLQSVFLRIVWSMENSSAQDRSELTFESFDLLSFSSFPARQADRQQGGFPLKAVYRDSVVGIRYMSTLNGTFRRFQVTFSSADHASQFIDSISSVCPCKANPMAGPPANLPQMLGVPSMVPPTLLHSVAKPPMLNNSVHAVPPITAAAALPSNYMQSDISLNQADIFSSQRLPTYPSMHFQHSNAPHPSVPGMPLSSSQMLIDHRNHLSSSSPLPPPSVQPAFSFGPRAYPQYTSTPIQSEVPYYSQTSSVDQHAAFNQVTINEPISSVASRTKVERSEKAVQTTDQFVFALREATSLYDLPHHNLEKLIGDVVREDGFVHLMESLSSMWKVKGYTNGQSDVKAGKNL